MSSPFLAECPTSPGALHDPARYKETMENFFAAGLSLMANEISEDRSMQIEEKFYALSSRLRDQAASSWDALNGVLQALDSAPSISELEPCAIYALEKHVMEESLLSHAALPNKKAKNKKHNTQHTQESRYTISLGQR